MGGSGGVAVRVADKPIDPLCPPPSNRSKGSKFSDGVGVSDNRGKTKPYLHRQQHLTEQQFTNAVLEWAAVYGWRRFHVRNSGANGMTQVQGDKGFPDLVLVKPPRLIFAELKVGKNKPTDAQLAWQRDIMASMNGRGPMECYQWRPEQWSQILVTLSKP